MKKVIAISSVKGGVGKTTLSYQLTHAFRDKGLTVCGLDMDRRHTLYESLSKNDDSGIDCYKVSDNLTMEDLNSIDANIIIIDGTPETNATYAKSIALSDYILIPLIPDHINVNVLFNDLSQALFSKVAKLNPNLKGSFVINRAKYNKISNTSKIKKTLLDNMELLSIIDENLPIMTTVYDRSAMVIEDSYNVFKSNNSKAKNEIGYLSDILLDKLKGL